jgi:hypothetical protein
MSASSQPPWPKTYSRAEAPHEVLDLTARLMSLLLAGHHPTNAVLREQYASASIREVRLTGVGFFIGFYVPPAVARTVPTSFEGGNVSIEVDGIKHPAGCVLFIRDGVISQLEGYTYGWDAWPEHPVVVASRDPVPIVPP